jgi:hypothetical protein
MAEWARGQGVGAWSGAKWTPIGGGAGVVLLVPREKKRGQLGRRGLQGVTSASPLVGSRSGTAEGGGPRTEGAPVRECPRSRFCGRRAIHKPVSQASWQWVSPPALAEGKGTRSLTTHCPSARLLRPCTLQTTPPPHEHSFANMLHAGGLHSSYHHHHHHPRTSPFWPTIGTAPWCRCTWPASTALTAFT